MNEFTVKIDHSLFLEVVVHVEIVLHMEIIENINSHL